MGWVVKATPWQIYRPEFPSTQCTGDWVGGRAGLDGFGFDPRTVHPVASRYTVLCGRRQRSVRCMEVGLAKQQFAADCQCICSQLCVEL